MTHDTQRVINTLQRQRDSLEAQADETYLERLRLHDLVDTQRREIQDLRGALADALDRARTAEHNAEILAMQSISSAPAPVSEVLAARDWRNFNRGKASSHASLHAFIRSCGNEAPKEFITKLTKVIDTLFVSED